MGQIYGGTDGNSAYRVRGPYNRFACIGRCNLLAGTRHTFRNRAHGAADGLGCRGGRIDDNVSRALSCIRGAFGGGLDGRRCVFCHLTGGLGQSFSEIKFYCQFVLLTYAGCAATSFILLRGAKHWVRWWIDDYGKWDASPFRFSRDKLPSAYLRERLLVLHLQVLFQGGVKFPTGGKSGGAKGVPWRRRGVCDRADESATRACVGSHAG